MLQFLTTFVYAFAVLTYFVVMEAAVIDVVITNTAIPAVIQHIIFVTAAVVTTETVGPDAVVADVREY